MAKLKLVLTVVVEYETSGVSEQELRRLLEDLPFRAADRGYFTGETVAEVEAWSASVKAVDG